MVNCVQGENRGTRQVSEETLSTRERGLDPGSGGAVGDGAGPPAEERLNFGMLEGLIGFHLRLANDRTFENFVELLGPDRLRPGCFTMLTLIANNPGITQIAISRASGRDKSSVTKALRYMEDAGLIRRVRLDDDRRSYASFVTEAGAELAGRMARKARIHIDHMASLLGEERAGLLLDLLKELIGKLPAAYEGRIKSDREG